MSTSRASRWLPLILAAAALLLILIPPATVHRLRAEAYWAALPLLSSDVSEKQLASAENLDDEGAGEGEVVVRMRSVLTAKHDEVQRLRAALGEMNAARLPASAADGLSGAVPAQVVARRMLWGEEYIAVDRGADDGVEVGAGVLHAGVVVGRVVGVASRAATIAFLTHRSVQVPVRLLKARGQGILKGVSSGSGEAVCQLGFVRDRVPVEPGDQVVTSGLDGTFPNGLPVGEVTECRLPAEGAFWDVRVTPSAVLDDLETVLILRLDAVKLPWPERNKAKAQVRK